MVGFYSMSDTPWRNGLFKGNGRWRSDWFIASHAKPTTMIAWRSDSSCSRHASSSGASHVSDGELQIVQNWAGSVSVLCGCRIFDYPSVRVFFHPFLYNRDGYRLNFHTTKSKRKHLFCASLRLLNLPIK